MEKMLPCYSSHENNAHENTLKTEELCKCNIIKVTLDSNNNADMTTRTLYNAFGTLEGMIFE